MDRNNPDSLRVHRSVCCVRFMAAALPQHVQTTCSVVRYGGKTQGVSATGFYVYIRFNGHVISLFPAFRNRFDGLTQAVQCFYTVLSVPKITGTRSMIAVCYGYGIKLYRINRINIIRDMVM